MVKSKCWNVGILFVAFLFSFKCLAFVDMKNADYSDTYTDIIVPGLGYDLTVKRSYHSRSLFNGMFGFGWCSDLETSLSLTPQNSILVTECGGGLEVEYQAEGVSSKSVNKTIATILKKARQKHPRKSENFWKKMEARMKIEPALRASYAKKLGLKGKVKTNVVYKANGSQDQKVVFNGQYYKRFLPDGSFQRFDKRGRLTHIHDKDGNYIKIMRQKSLIRAVIDNKGNRLDFKYASGSKRVAQIVGPKVKASYVFAKENLVSSTNMWGNTFKYRYDNLHNMTRIDYPDKTFKALTYDTTKDWVMSFRNRKGCLENYNYIIDEKNPNYYKSTVKKVCGSRVTNNSVYEFWHKNRKDGSGRYLARTRAKVNNLVRDILYHPKFGRPVQIVQNGRKTKFTFSESTGKLLKRTEKDFTITYAYKNSCQKVSDVVRTYFTQDAKRKAASVSKVLKTHFVYDSQKCKMKLAKNSDGLSIGILYDKNGRPNQFTDQSKRVLKIAYDPKVELPAVLTRPGLGTVRLKYRDGKIVNVESPQGQKAAMQVATVFNNYLEIISLAQVEI